MPIVRLQKFVSECGLMSRRAAEKEITAGAFTVNGKTAALGDKVDTDCDTVLYKGKKIGGDSSHRLTYIMLNKPAGYVTTMSDDEGRLTAAMLVADAGVRVYPVGRLDMYSEGLLLFTNDGELANRVMHPSHEIAKKYIAVVTSHLGENDVRALEEQIELDGYRLRPFEVRLIGYTKCGNAESTELEFTLHEGRNREIRGICAHHGLRLASLRRISVGEITLGSLESGKWRYLTEDEINYIKNV